MKAGVLSSALILWAAAALAAGVVGDGTPASCTEAALDAALGCGPASGNPPYSFCSGGGTVTFNCGPRPFTLKLKNNKEIDADTRIDGGNLITLRSVPIEGDLSYNNTTSELSNITLRHVFVDTGFDTILDVNHAAFTRNRTTEQFGAAITNFGTLNVTNSIFTHNVALAGDTCVGGAGAIDTEVGTVRVTNSLFVNNAAPGGCGGGALYNNYGTFTVTNSTFVNNRVPGGYGGGAIYNQGGSMTVTNCTFTKNHGSGRGGAGVIHVEDDSVTLQNTILVGNSFPNCSGSVTDGGHNLRWPRAEASCPGAPGNPRLASLKDNGGPTKTMALRSGSAAINAGDNTICATGDVNNLDQRGYVRPGAGVTNCSIGAFEFNAAPQP